MDPQFVPGDIAACYGADSISQTISDGTWSLWAPSRLRRGPSHLAILCDDSTEGSIWVESTSTCPHPCLFRKLHVGGVQAQRPLDRLADYEEIGGRIDLYRLNRLNRLTAGESALLTSLLRNLIEEGISYDSAGAILSGLRYVKWSEYWPGADLDRLFCSEMIAAVLQRLGRMNRRNPSLFNPANLMRCLVRGGVYSFYTDCFPRIYSSPEETAT